MKTTKSYQSKVKSDLSRHSVNGGKHSAKKWVSQNQIQTILKEVKETVSTINASRQSIFEMNRILYSMEYLVSYNNSSKKTLPQLYYEFWSTWDDFKRILFLNVQPEGSSSAIRAKLSKASDILYASEKNFPDDKYDKNKFDYICNKISLIYESLEGIPDMHNCKRIFTVVTQNYQSFFIDQATAEKFLKNIRHCIKIIKVVIESAQPIINVIQESENKLRDLVPESLTMVRGKSVSQKRSFARQNPKPISVGPPSFATPITTDLTPKAGSRSIKNKYGTSSRAKSVVPIRNSLSYQSISGATSHYDSKSYYGDHPRNIKYQGSDKKSVSGSSYHRSNIKK